MNCPKYGNILRETTYNQFICLNDNKIKHILNEPWVDEYWEGCKNQPSDQVDGKDCESRRGNHGL